MRKGFIILIVLFSVFLAIGCTGTNNQEPATPTETPVETPAVPTSGKIVDVTIQNFAFNPDSVTISSDDTVKWTNMDSATHTITGTDFSSGNLNKGDSYENTFTKAGTYDYYCSIHPSMKGTIIVE